MVWSEDQLFWGGGSVNPTHIRSLKNGKQHVTLGTRLAFAAASRGLSAAVVTIVRTDAASRRSKMSPFV